MASTETPAKPAADAAPDTESGWGGMDTLGLIAAVLLVFIVADIVTDGRIISRRLRGSRQQPAPEPVPND